MTRIFPALHRGCGWLVLGSVILSGCGGSELPGNLFNLQLSGADNQCTGDGTGQQERHEYRVVREGVDIEIAIGEDIWANGTINGCQIEYTSITWTSLPRRLRAAVADPRRGLGGPRGW